MIRPDSCSIELALRFCAPLTGFFKIWFRFVLLAHENFITTNINIGLRRPVPVLEGLPERRIFCVTMLDIWLAEGMMRDRRPEDSRALTAIAVAGTQEYAW